MAALTGGRPRVSLLRIDVQQVVAERRFAAFFTPLFSLRIVEGGVLAGRSLGGTHRDRE